MIYLKPIFVEMLDKFPILFIFITNIEDRFYQGQR